MEAFFEMGQFGAFVGEAGILVMHGGIVPSNRAAAEPIPKNFEKLARIAKTLPIGRQCKAGAQFKALRG